MALLKATSSIRDLQRFTETVYGLNNRRHWSTDEMLIQVERFAMRGLKGIRKGDKEKTVANLLAAMSWFLSLLNILGIDAEDELWHRFPYRCSYCGECPCVCRVKKVKKRLPLRATPRHARPKTLRGYEEMFARIYPPSERTLEHAGIHLAEEVGEVAEAMLRFRGSHRAKDFDEIRLEAADLFSCFFGVFNSLGVSGVAHFITTHADGCASCRTRPCSCEYDYVINFRS